MQQGITKARAFPSFIIFSIKRAVPWDPSLSPGRKVDASTFVDRSLDDIDSRVILPGVLRRVRAMYRVEGKRLSVDEFYTFENFFFFLRCTLLLTKVKP